MIRTEQTLLSLGILLGIALATAPAPAVTVSNPNFDPPTEDTSDNPNPGYGPVSGWTRSGANVGVSNNSQPFLNQAAHSGTHSAFIQNGGNISQALSGFDPAKLYTVTYFVSERGLSGAAASTSVSLDGGATSYAAPGNIVKTDAFRRIVSGPLSVSGATSTLQLKSVGVSGDNSLLLDSVSISRAVPLVGDGGFENPVQPTGSSGYELGNGAGGGSLAGSAWNFGSSPSGIVRNGSAFNGGTVLAPEGSQAGLLRSTSQITTTVSGFEAGVSYSLSFEALGRTGTLGPNEVQVLLDGTILEFGGASSVTPGQSSWTTFTTDAFITNGGSLDLTFQGLTGGDKATFFDDIRFNFVGEAVPEPGSALLTMLGLAALLVRHRRP